MPNDKFYTGKQWRSLRAFKLSLNPMCERYGCKNVATEVHHIKERRHFPHLELYLKNLEALCKSCHSRHTAGQTKQIFKPYKLKYD